MFFGGALIVGGWGVVVWGRKSYLGPAEIASFSNRDFSRSNKHDTFWHVVSTGYFYVLFLWAIAVTDFRSCEIKILAFPCLLSLLQATATQITISVNIFICLKHHTVWNQFFLLFFFIFSYFYFILITTMVYRKNSL